MIQSLDQSKKPTDTCEYFCLFYYFFSLKSNADESPRSYGLLIASMLNTNETCNSVIGYQKKKKKRKEKKSSFTLHQINSFAFNGVGKKNGYK